MNKFKWYALLVAQKKEFFVKNKIENSQEDVVKESIKEVLLPTEKEIYEIRRKKVVKNIPIYPNYLFLHASLTKGVCSHLSEMTFIVRMLGVNGHPTPIREKEIDLVRVMAGAEKLYGAYKYKIGDVVSIIGGHCKGLTGRVLDVLDVDKLKIEIPIFNRAIYSTIKVEDLNHA